MSRMWTESKRNLALQKRSISPCLNTIVMMGLFTFLFLGAEYLYDNMISAAASEQNTVLAQNYALGISAAGFLVYPLFNRFLKNRGRTVCFCLLAAACVLCLFLICRGLSYETTLVAGLVLFLFLGLLGSAVFYRSVCMLKEDRRLGRIVGISYMLGILLQFANNNLVNSDTVEAGILSVFLPVLVFLLVKAEQSGSEQKEDKAALAQTDKSQSGASQKTTQTAAGLLLILLVVLMTCVFSTLDNVVTLVHAAGAADIGQWPRLLLAFGGLAAGFVFDIKNRSFMSLSMFCVMMLSTACIVILGFGGPFLLGLIVFYISAGFFAVFFTTGFMELSPYMSLPELWAGMGRAVNNITAAVIANGSLMLLTSDSGMTANILVLVLFAAVSIVTAAYASKRRAVIEKPLVNTAAEVNQKDKLQEFSKSVSLTPRETEVFDRLVNTEDSLQTVAESLYISKRTLERYVSAIYRKTGVKSRVGLIRLYHDR